MRVFLFLILFLSTCSSPKTSTSSSPVASLATTQPGVCPEKPAGSLNGSKVKAIVLSSQDQPESGMVKAGESVGFSFESKGNEKFNYATKDNLCIWIFSPDNQVIQGTQLTKKGRYTVQVSLPTGSASFELAMRLESPKQASPTPQPSVPPLSSSTPKSSSTSIRESTERVSFAKGTTTATIQDTATSSQLTHYLLQCAAGQTMTIRSQNSAVNIRIVDPNGNTIGRISSSDSNWRGNLPSDGDYSLDVSSSSSSSFSIQVEVL